MSMHYAIALAEFVKRTGPGQGMRREESGDPRHAGTFSSEDPKIRRDTGLAICN